MKALISNTLLSQIKCTGTEYDIWDTKLTGFILRVSAKGKLVYRCEYARGKRMTLGSTKVLTPVQARDKAMKVIGAHVNDILPKKRKQQLSLSLILFLEKEYGPWVTTDRKSGAKTLYLIKYHFSEFLPLPLQEVTVHRLEKWRMNALNAGKAVATINRDIVRLKSALSKAVAWELIDTNPLAKLKPLKNENTGIVRYLTDAEEKRLRQALQNRNTKIRNKLEDAVASSIKAIDEEGHKASTVSQDYLYAMVLLAINTGIRRGELFNLLWSHVDFANKILTIDSSHSKSGKSRYIPLNTEAYSILQEWRQLTSDSGSELIFPNQYGTVFENVNKSWHTLLRKAQVENFRWHDLRHHFASRLVMAGVDLNTVRELLGHGDLTMTLRYAHLAPEHKANAVAKLVTNPKSYN